MRLAMVCVLPVPGGPWTRTHPSRSRRTAIRICSGLAGLLSKTSSGSSPGSKVSAFSSGDEKAETFEQGDEPEEVLLSKPANPEQIRVGGLAEQDFFRLVRSEEHT